MDILPQEPQENDLTPLLQMRNSDHELQFVKSIFPDSDVRLVGGSYIGRWYQGAKSIVAIVNHEHRLVVIRGGWLGVWGIQVTIDEPPSFEDDTAHWATVLRRGNPKVVSKETYGAMNDLGYDLGVM